MFQILFLFFYIEFNTMIYAMLLTQFINHASQLALMLHIIFYDFCSSLFYIKKKKNSSFLLNY